MTRVKAIEIYLKNDVKETCMKYQESILQKIDEHFVTMIEQVSTQIVLFYQGIVK